MTWDDAVRDALARFPDVALDPAAFTAHAAHAREAGALAEHLPDLLLAWAAARGDPAAVRRVGELAAPDIAAAAARVDRTLLDEVRQQVQVRLLVARDGAPPRIAAYGGRGPLRAWIGIAATRLALNLKRGELPVASGDDVLADLVAAEPDPELRQLRTLYRAEFRVALEAALAALPERQRALLRMSYVDGIRLAAIGRLYGVHESTASRWVAAAAEAVGQDARRRLIERLSLSPGTVDSVARMVLSGLDLSIARLLR